MLWALNPLPTPSSTPKPSADEVEGSDDPEGGISQGESPQGIPKHFRGPSERFTTHQIFYIFVFTGLGGAVLSGAINFAIAYGMYATAKAPIRLFQFPYTLAGDGAFSIPIQCTITWWLELWLVNRDLRRGKVQAIGFVPEPSCRFVRWFMFLDRNQDEQGQRGQEEDHETVSRSRSRCCMRSTHFALSQFTRALLASLLAFAVLWGPGVGILTAFSFNRRRQFPVPCAGLAVPYACQVVQAVRNAAVATPICGKDWCYWKRWAPQIFKTARGSVLAVLTAPLFVMFWLVRCGWALKEKEKGKWKERIEVT